MHELMLQAGVQCIGISKRNERGNWHVFMIMVISTFVNFIYSIKSFGHKCG